MTNGFGCHLYSSPTVALLYADAAILAERAKTLDLTAAAIERGEHMETNDG